MLRTIKPVTRYKSDRTKPCKAIRKALNASHRTSNRIECRLIVQTQGGQF